MWELTLLFLGGAVWDFIITTDLLMKVKRNVPLVILTTFALAILPVLVYQNLLLSGLEAGRLVAYVAGSCTGAVVPLMIEKRRKHNVPGR